MQLARIFHTVTSQLCVGSSQAQFMFIVDHYLMSQS